MNSDANHCTRCSAASVCFDDEGSCFVCQSCGFVVSQDELSTYPDVVQQTVNPNPALYSAADTAKHPGASTLDFGTRGAFSGESIVAVQTRARRQRQQQDQLQALAAALRLPGPVVQMANSLLTQIHQASRAVSAKRRRVDGDGDEDDHPGTQPSSGVACWVAGGGDGGDGRSYSDDEYGDEGMPYHHDDHEDDAEAGPGAAAAPRTAVADAAAAAAGMLREEEDPTSSGAPERRQPPALGGQESGARLGALLYLASRCEGGTLTLMEVAERTCTDLFRLAELARDQAAFLRLSLPLMDVERFVMRMARQLVASDQLDGPHRDQQGRQQQTQQHHAAPAYQAGSGNGMHSVTGPGGVSGDADEEEAGAGAAAVVVVVSAPAPVAVSEEAVWRHPLVRLASRLTELVVRRGWHEGRAPRTVAGALLSICLDSLYPEKAAAATRAKAGSSSGDCGGSGGVGPVLTEAQLRQSVMCGRTQLWSLKQEILGRLVQLASGLPFGALVGPGNVATYLEVLIAGEGLSETWREQQQQQLGRKG